MLRLPKDLLTHPHMQALEDYFVTTERPLRAEASDGTPVREVASYWAFDDACRLALQAVRPRGALVQGIEQIAELLKKEQQGLTAQEAKLDQPAGERLSRLILLANDGSPRFYRSAANLVGRYGNRVWICQLDVDAAAFGKAVTAKGSPVKAVMLGDKQTLTQFLGLIADGLGTKTLAPGS